MVELAARAARREPVQMHVDVVRAEPRIDELDLLAPPAGHGLDCAPVEVRDPEYRFLGAHVRCSSNMYVISAFWTVSPRYSGLRPSARTTFPQRASSLLI